MKIAFLTNEYPPHIYGGAGVHAEYLSQELTRQDEGRHQVQVLCFGEQLETGSPNVKVVRGGIEFPAEDPRHKRVFDALYRNIFMAGYASKPEIVHCHTWYTHFAGCLVKQISGAKLVLTTHSLEPHRPWKVEQLGSAYHASTWIERTAYQNADGIIAVSKSMQNDVCTSYGIDRAKTIVIPNGIDLNEFKPTHDEEWLRSKGIDPAKPFALFVGRITRQKGILHLVNALPHLAPDVQMVLCAGSPDTPEINTEMIQSIEAMRKVAKCKIIWISEMLPRDRLITLYSSAAVFVCPSVYEPFGIINLEAMACHTPVVASAVGGITEVVVDGETGLLIPLKAVSDSNFEPQNAGEFSFGLAKGINSLIHSPEKRQKMGLVARKRVEAEFSWPSVARRTLDYYRSLG